MSIYCYFLTYWQNVWMLYISSKYTINDLYSISASYIWSISICWANTRVSFRMYKFIYLTKWHIHCNTRWMMNSSNIHLKVQKWEYKICLFSQIWIVNYTYLYIQYVYKSIIRVHKIVFQWWNDAELFKVNYMY